MWKVDQRVWGRKGSEPYWHCGTVKHIDGQRCYIIFDDGDDALVEFKELKALELQVGGRVLARLPMEAEFKPAKVLDWDHEKVKVRWSNGEENWTSFGMIRLPSETDVTVHEHAWSEGDRVFAWWQDQFWYPGAVLAIDGEQHHVLFDDGSQALLPADRLKPLEFEVGDRVFCRWKGGRQYFPGEITQRRGEVIHVHYDDGDEETTLIRLVRIASDSSADLGQPSV